MDKIFNQIIFVIFQFRKEDGRNRGIKMQDHDIQGKQSSNSFPDFEITLRKRIFIPTFLEVKYSQGTSPNGSPATLCLFCEGVSGHLDMSLVNHKMKIGNT